MTQPTNPGNDPQPPTPNSQPPTQRRSRRRKILLGVGGTVLVGTVGAIGYSWFFIQRQLSPLIADNLTQVLDRPVNLGPVEGFSLGKIRFGETEIPSTPTEENQASLEAIEISFDLIPLVFNRRLQISATLIEPNVEIIQAQDGNWVPTLPEPGEPGEIEVQLGQIQVQDASITLIARDQEEKLKPPLELTLPSTLLRFRDENTVIEVDTEGSFGQGGQFQLSGMVMTKKKQAKLNLLANEVELVQFSHLVNLPVTLESGQMSANVESSLNYQSPDCPLFTADCDLIQDLRGTAKIEEVAVSSEDLPASITETNANLSFRETTVRVEQFSTLVGKIPATAQGTVDLKSGVNLTAQTEPITVEQIFQTLDLKAPKIPLASTLQTTLQVTGTPTNPLVTGKVTSTRLTQIDKVNFKTIAANFTFKDSNLLVTRFQANPVVGGQILGKGNVKLGKNAGLVFNAKAQNLPVEALAKPYGVTLPISLTSFNGQAQIFGPLGDPKKLRATVSGAVPVAGGVVTADVRNLQLGAKRWRGTANIVGINLGQIPQLPPLIQQQGGVVNGRLNLAGQLDSFELNTLEANGFVNMNIAGGTLQVRDIQLNQGRYRTQIVASGIQTGQFVTSVPALASVPSQFLGNVNGQLNLSGDLASLTTRTVNANGFVNMNIAGGILQVQDIQLNQGRYRTQIVASGIQTGQFVNSVPALASVPSQFLGNVNGQLNLSGDVDRLAKGEVNGNGSVGIDVAGGVVRATQINLAQGNWNVRVQTRNVQVAQLLPVSPVSSRLNSDFALSGRLDNFTPATLRGQGSAQLLLAQGTLNTTLNLKGGRWQANAIASEIPVASLVPQIPNELGGNASGNLNVAGSLTDFTPETIRATGKGRLVLNSGEITATNIEVANGNWRTSLNAQLPITSAQCSLLLQDCSLIDVFQPRIAGNFNVAGNLANLTPTGISATGNARVDLKDGSIAANNIRIVNGDWQGNVNAQVSLANEQCFLLLEECSLLTGFNPRIDGNFNVAGNLANLTLTGIRATGMARIASAQGTINATEVRLLGGNFNATVDSNLNLAQLSPRLSGELDSNLQIAGNVNNLTPTGIQAGGTVNLSEGFDPLEGAVAADFQWSGQRLTLNEFTADNLDVRGDIDVNLANSGLDLIEQVDLAINIDTLNLSKLVGVVQNFATLPPAVNNLALNGEVGFEGTVTGNLRDPNVQGDLLLQEFAVDTIAFDDRLEGPVSFTSQGVDVRLQGENDRINFALDSNYLPRTVSLRLDEVEVAGQRRGDWLTVDTENVPLNLLATAASGLPQLEGIMLPLGSFPNLSLSGTLSSEDLAVNLNTLEVSGKLSVDRVQIQELLVLLQRYEIADFGRGLNPPSYGTAADLNIYPVESPNQRVIDQLHRFSEVEQLLAQQQRQRASGSLIPPLANLRGTIGGTVELAGSLKGKNQLGIPDFRFQGENWVWCETLKTGEIDCDLTPYIAESVEVQGSFQEGVVNLVPVKLELAEGGILGFNGTFGGETQTGKLILQDIPIDLVYDILKLPAFVALDGKLEGDINIGGTPQNPNARGSLALKDAQILGSRRASNTKFQSAQGNFSYSNAVLNFSFQSVLENDPSAFTFFVRFPYQLGSTPPDRDNNKVLLRLEKERTNNLALLSILTAGDVEWLGGEGEISLNVDSSLKPGESLNIDSIPELLEQLSQSCFLGQQSLETGAGSDRLADPSIQTAECLTVKGRIDLNEAILQPVFLSDPITAINGTINFNFNNLEIQNLQGTFGGGDVIITGGLPLSKPNPEQELSVVLPQLQLALKGLYNGNIQQGDVTIGGTALEPKIRGEVLLSNGRVLLAGSGSSKSGGDTQGGGEESSSDFKPQLDGLQLILGNNIEVTQPPVLNFLATGRLTLAGGVNNPVPRCEVQLDGINPCEIILQRGQVNLFTTQFRLDRGHRNTAQFIPGQGLDPLLNVRLISSVTEASRQLIGADPTSSEINDADLNNFGSTQTLRVQARFSGFASDLKEITTDSLELTSSPPRSETELVALLGGSFIQTFTEDATLGLANLAGNTFLGTFQNALRDAWGLGEFRLFPTSVIEEDEEDRTSSSLGLGAEIGIDISNNFSLSAIKVLTSDQPFQYGIRYRLNDYTILRGSTDFSGDNRATVEYEFRF